MEPIKRSQLVWIVVTNGTTLNGAYIPFPDQPDLRGKQITGIECINSDYLTNAPDGTTCFSSADETHCMLTLYKGAVMQEKDVPCASLDSQLNFGIWKQFEPFQVNWQRSGVRVVSPLSAALLAIPFLVHYMD